MTDSHQNTITFSKLCDTCGKAVEAFRTTEFAVQSLHARDYGWSHIAAGFSLQEEMRCKPQAWERTVNGEYATENDLD